MKGLTYIYLSFFFLLFIIPSSRWMIVFSPIFLFSKELLWWHNRFKNARFVLIYLFSVNGPFLFFRFVLFISGLDLGGKEERPFQMQMMADLITGQMGDPSQQSAAASICHMIVAGNSLSQSTKDRDMLTKVG